MHMAGQKSAKSTSSQKNSEDKFWKSSSNQARYDETLEQSQIFAGGGTEITGAQGVVIDRAREKHSHANGKKNKGKPRTSENIRDDSNLPGQDWMKLQGATYNDVDEAHQTMNFRQQGMTAAAKVVVTLIVIIATSGAGSFLAGGGAAGAGAGGAATAASTSLSIGQAVTQFATQAATSLGFSASMAANIGVGVSAMACAGMAKAVVAGIDNRGNLVNTTKDLATKEQALDLLATGVTAGATKGIASSLKIPTTHLTGFSQHAAYNAVRAGVSTGVNMARGQKAGDALRAGGVGLVAGTVSGMLASEIGDWRKDNILNRNIGEYAAHKGMHIASAALIGAISEALLGGNKKDIVNAAIGSGLSAGVAEVIAEKIIMDGHIRAVFQAYDIQQREDRIVSPAEIEDMMNAEYEHASALGKLTGTTSAFLAGQNVNYALSASTNSVENNLVFAVAPVVMGAIKLYDIISTSMEAKDVYEEGGLTALGKYAATNGALNMTGGAALKIGKVAVKGTGRYVSKVFRNDDVVAKESLDLISKKVPANGSNVHKRVNITDREAQGVYDPHKWQKSFEAKYGKEMVKSSTLINEKKIVSQHSKSFQVDPGYRVPYDWRGNPIFDAHKTYETVISPSKFYGLSRSSHMRAATRQLRNDITNGKFPASKFTPQQLKDITAGKEKISGKTWHHDQKMRNMQLIPERIHDYNKHVGSISLMKKGKS